MATIYEERAKIFKAIYILHMYTKEKLMKRKNAVYLILAFFQIKNPYPVTEQNTDYPV